MSYCLWLVVALVAYNSTALCYSMTADNLLVITRDLQRSCFAPTNT
ncbi:hypothetical protein [Microcoleus anatoxicus]